MNGIPISLSGRVPRTRRFDPWIEAIIMDEGLRYWTDRNMKTGDVVAAVALRVQEVNRRLAAASLAPLKSPGREAIRRRLTRAPAATEYASKVGTIAARRRRDRC